MKDELIGNNGKLHTMHRRKVLIALMAAIAATAIADICAITVFDSTPCSWGLHAFNGACRACDQCDDTCLRPGSICKNWYAINNDCGSYCWDIQSHTGTIFWYNHNDLSELTAGEEGVPHCGVTPPSTLCDGYCTDWASFTNRPESFNECEVRPPTSCY